MKPPSLSNETMCALLKAKQSNDVPTNRQSGGVEPLPEDADYLLDQRAFLWLKKYGLTDLEIASNNILWSKSQEQLIFPIKDADGNLVAWQARNFKAGAKKYFTRGSMDSILHILGLTIGKDRGIILVEDVVSAIKVARHCPTMPLFGSSCSKSKLSRLGRYTNQIRFWLDRDKLNQSMMLAKLAKQLGMSAKVIYTEKDPKELSDSDITACCQT